MNPLNQVSKQCRPWSLRRLSRITSSLLRQLSQPASQEVIIPKRIQRGPTDILKALANTVQTDYTAPHYKYHDDPYFIPMSNMGKRTFAMAKESGRKAAQWIRQENPMWFQHKVADPPIEAFSPQPKYDEKSEVNEGILEKLIDNVLVSDAITVYELLETKGQGVSVGTKQKLLELLCFYNCEDALSSDLTEERWFRQGVIRGRQRKTWKDKGLAEKLFQSMGPLNQQAYCALLQGMTRYYQADGAWQLYLEMQDKGLPLTTEAFNSLIRITPFLREGHDLRWNLVEELLTTMSKQEQQPNIGTLNAVLEAVSNMGASKVAKNSALRSLAEFKGLGIEPSLASFYFLLIIFCKERGPICSILVEIMECLEGRSLEIRDPKDTFFFVTAMDVCRNHLVDKDLAKRVDRLLHAEGNSTLIGDSYKESIYYRHLFALLCQTEPLEVFMEYYNKVVPNIYIPEPGIMEEVIKSVDLQGAHEHFPRLWADMKMFDQTQREALVLAILAAMVRNSPPAESNLHAQFAEVAWDVWTSIEERDPERYSQLNWSGWMLGDVMVLVLRGGDFSKACQVLGKMSLHSTAGLPDTEALKLFLDICITRNDPTNAMKCIQYCVEAGFPESGQMARQLKSSMTLNEGQISQLTNAVGREAMSG